MAKQLIVIFLYSIKLQQQPYPWYLHPSIKKKKKKKVYLRVKVTLWPSGL